VGGEPPHSAAVDTRPPSAAHQLSLFRRPYPQRNNLENHPSGESPGRLLLIFLAAAILGTSPHARFWGAVEGVTEAQKTLCDVLSEMESLDV